MSGKKLLIGPAEEQIRTLLSQSGDPLAALKAIQNDYGLDLAGIDDMYPLLDLCGCSRLEIHKACLDALNKATVDHIEQPSFGIEEFHDLFSKTFPYIHIPLMQQIPMALLKKFENDIDQNIINQLKSNPAVFENCPMNIKQKIWKQNEPYFQETMLSVLNDYHHDEELQLLDLNLKVDTFQEMIEIRRTHPIVLKVMDTIGRDAQIYRMFVEMLRIVFKATPYPSLCSLRVDVLMNFHDLDYKQITSIDKCYKLIYNLDSCIRTQSMDYATVERIKKCFDDVKNGTPLYADFAMVLMDPMISNFLATCIVKCLKNSLENTNAAENSRLEDLTNYCGKLLNLAEHAPNAIAYDTKIPKLDKDLKSEFWSSVCNVMVDEQAETLQNIKESDRTSILKSLRRSDIARKVFVHYLLDRAQEGDIGTLCKCLPLIVESWPDPSFDEEGIIYRQTYLSFIKTFMDTIVKRHLQDCVMDFYWRREVVEGFLLLVVSWDVRIHEHMIRLLAEYYLDPKILLKLDQDAAVLGEWTNIIARNGLKDEKHNQQLKATYEHLLSRSKNALNGKFEIDPPEAIQFL